MYLHTVIFVFNEPATSEIYTLSLHDALPIYNPDDEELTLRAFEESGVSNEIVVARDGAEALDFILGTGVYTGRDLSVMPMVVLLDLNLPKISGLEVLRRVRANPPTKLLPVVILTSS